MEKSKDRKVALVTGASRGIGRAIAVELGGKGCHVVLNYRSQQAAAEEALERVQEVGGTGELCPFDVSRKEECERAVEGLLATHGCVPILINNAGIRRDGLFVFMKDPQWLEVLNTNLSSFYHLCRLLTPAMAMNRWGRIVSIASVSGQTGVEGQVNYSASKAAVIGASRSLALELAKRKVTVNVVAPGFIETEMLGDLPRKELIARIPAGRLGKPEEVAAVVSFLCSDAAGYITGNVVNVNGGVFT